MNDLQEFMFEGNQVRIINQDGEPWFVAKDVCAILEVGNTSDVVARLDDDEKGIDFVDTLGGKQKMTIINESGLYAVVLRSDKSEARRLRKWVTSEILPSIRKHGAYATEQTIDKILNDPDFGIQLLTTLKEERVARVEAERRNAVLMHVSKTYTATEMAKEMGMRSAQELNKFLSDKHIQFFQNGTWVPYADYASLGYFEIKQEVLDNGKVIYHRRITQDGRAFILGLR